MLASTKDTHPCSIGDSEYLFRSPDVYDTARMRRYLTRQRVRRPSAEELQVAALAGVAALAETVGDPAEGERQSGLLDEWYRLSEPIKEEDIDEPDLELRAAELARLEAERLAAMVVIHPEVAAIRANLERHWGPYAELLADRNFWDDVSRVDVVRLLLVKIGAMGEAGAAVPLDDDRMLTQAAYMEIPRDHRFALATFAFRLLTPDETQRKN